MRNTMVRVDELSRMGVDISEWNISPDYFVVVSENGSVNLLNGSEVDGPCEFIAKLFFQKE